MSGYVTGDDSTFVFGAFASRVDRELVPLSDDAPPQQLAESEQNQGRVPDLVSPIEPSVDPSPEQ